MIEDPWWREIAEKPIRQISARDIKTLIEEIERLRILRNLDQYTWYPFAAGYIHYLDGNVASFKLSRIGWRPRDEFPKEFMLPLSPTGSFKVAEVSEAQMLSARKFRLLRLAEWDGSPHYEEVE